MKNLLYTLVLIITVNFSSAQTIFQNKSLGFSMEQPKDWIIAETGETLQNLKEQIKLDNKDLRKLIDENKGTYQVVSFYKYAIRSIAGVIPTIKVNLRTNNSSSFEMFKNSIEQSYKGTKEIFPDFQFLTSPIEKQIDGKQCVYASCVYTLKAKSGEEKVKIIVYAIPVEDKFYQITFMDSEKENNLDLFEEISKTIKIN